MSFLVVDSHCHLDYEGLTERLPEVLANAEAAGVGLMVSIGTQVKKFERLLRIAEDNANVFCTVGTHPHHAHEELDVTVAELVELAKHPKVVGIGEAGLDYHYDLSPRAAQAQGFRAHIAAARETGLPLVIHAREADADVASILEDEMKQGAFKPLAPLFHVFHGAWPARAGAWRLCFILRHPHLQERREFAGRGGGGADGQAAGGNGFALSGAGSAIAANPMNRRLLSKHLSNWRRLKV